MRDVISMFQCSHEKKKIKLHLLSCTVVRKSIVGMNRETVTASFQILVLQVYFTYSIHLNNIRFILLSYRSNLEFKKMLNGL